MGMSYPDGRCSESPIGAHHYVHLATGIWRCKYCWAVAWFPLDMGNATSYSNNIRKIGLDRAYGKALEARPGIAIRLGKLEAIRLIRNTVPDEELLVAVAAIVNDKSGGWRDRDGSVVQLSSYDATLISRGGGLTF